MSNENNNLQNEDTNERIDSEVISDISNCDDDDAPLSDEVGEEQEIAISPEESPQKKKRARERNISLKAYLFSTVAIILATLLLTYSICAEVFRAKYADNLVIQEQESTTAKVGIDLLNE